MINWDKDIYVYVLGHPRLPVVSNRNGASQGVRNLCAQQAPVNGSDLVRQGKCRLRSESVREQEQVNKGFGPLLG